MDMDEPVRTVVVAREDGIPRDVEATTPGRSMPNVAVVAMGYTRVILTRAARSFFATLSGLLGITATGYSPMPVTDFWDAVVKASAIAAGAACASAILNLTELLMQLDTKWPELRA